MQRMSPAPSLASPVISSRYDRSAAQQAHHSGGWGCPRGTAHVLGAPVESTMACATLTLACAGSRPVQFDKYKLEEKQVESPAQ